MKMTLLEIVQDILSDMSSDFANSIGDTEESMQVAQIVKTTYHEMMNRREWPHLKKLTTLLSVANKKYPTMLLVPEMTKRLEWVTYNQKKELADPDSYNLIKFMEPNRFIQYTNSRNTDNDNVSVMENPNGVPIRIITNSPPTYWTSFNDETIVMDSYVSTIEDTLQGHNTQAELYVFPDWQDADDFVPDMPATLFPALLAEAKSTAFFTIKGVANEKAEQQSRRQQGFLSVRGWRLEGGIRYPDYGRKRWVR